MPASAAIFIGLDLGTSGCRAVAIDGAGTLLATARAPLPAPATPAPGWSEQDPECWWQAALTVLRQLRSDLPDRTPAALCVDATSGTLVLSAPDGTPLGPALMYSDRRATRAASRIDALAPLDSPARGPTASLAKALHLVEQIAGSTDVLALHQADWILGRRSGQPGISDWNNALKLGYDVERLSWPDWVRDLTAPRIRLPRVVAPGTPLVPLAEPVARDLGWTTTPLVVAGTTDSTAAVIATGASRPGEAVTSLGTTLVIKIIAERPVTAPALGVYSHRLGERWLVGGASNSGGAVLRQFFSDQEIAALSSAIDPQRPSGLDYYPLPATGERFPRADPDRAPRLEPRPSDPVRFLQGLLEGIAAIEAEGYRRLMELGAPRPARILTIGGGARNPTWTQLRARVLGIEVAPATHQEAALGAAWLARAASMISA